MWKDQIMKIDINNDNKFNILEFCDCDLFKYFKEVI